MFKPRHGYRSPITHRYRGQAKGCPIFSNLDEITSDMVEDHDECLECLSKLKNRIDIYRNLAENNKPSNTVIKSLQKLSSSSTNNRLKTCLQFLIIKVNENATSSNNNQTTRKQTTDEFHKDGTNNNVSSESSDLLTRTLINRRERFNGNIVDHEQLAKQDINRISKSKDYESYERSPSQELVSSTQDQVETSSDQLSDIEKRWQKTISGNQVECSQSNYERDSDNEFDIHQSTTTAHSRDCSTSTDYTFTTLVNESATISKETDSKLIPFGHSTSKESLNNAQNTYQIALSTDETTLCTDSSRRSAHEDSDASMQSWHEFTSSQSSDDSSQSSSTDSTSSICSSKSCACHNIPTFKPKKTNDIVCKNHDVRLPKLKLTDEKLRKIRNRPLYFKHSTINRFNKLDTKSHCIMGDSKASITSSTTEGCQKSHTFQAPPHFTNQLLVNSRPGFQQSSHSPFATSFKGLPSMPSSLSSSLETPKSKQPLATGAAPTTTTINIANIRGMGSSLNKTDSQSIRDTKVELLNCSICGIRAKSTSTSNRYGPDTCFICVKYFSSFLRDPHELFCAQDGNCLMTFDSRCQACWVKICIQKFDLTPEQRRKIKLDSFAPKLLSKPNVPLI